MSTFYWCKKCAPPESKNSGVMRQIIVKGVNIICEGCEPERFNLLKYGKPLKIERPSQETEHKFIME